MVKGQIPWNYGEHLSAEYRKKISEKMTGRTLTKSHKKHIADSQKKRLSEIKICSQCSMKNKWIYGVIIRQIGDYMIHLCDNCLVDQFRNNKKIEVVE